MSYASNDAKAARMMKADLIDKDAQIVGLKAQLSAAQLAAQGLRAALDEIEDGACGGHYADCDQKCKRIASAALAAPAPDFAQPICPDCNGTMQDPEEGCEMQHAPTCLQMRLRSLGHVDPTYKDRSAASAPDMGAWERLVEAAKVIADPRFVLWDINAGEEPLIAVRAALAEVQRLMGRAG